MPSFIIKPDAEEDFYVNWSTVVDAPLQWGTREELMYDLGNENGGIPERFDCADRYGTSMCDPNLPRDDQWFGWNETKFLVREIVPHWDKYITLIKREDLKEMCHRLETDDDTEDLLIKENIDDEVV